MAKVTKVHFELFKRECKKWIDGFELNNWEVHFSHVALKKGDKAALDWRIDGYVAWIELALEWGEGEVNEKNIKYTAKHEVLHLLTGRLLAQGRSRYISAAEIDEAAEELVQKLCHIIK